MHCVLQCVVALDALCVAVCHGGLLVCCAVYSYLIAAVLLLLAIS